MVSTGYRRPETTVHRNATFSIRALVLLMLAAGAPLEAGSGGDKERKQLDHQRARRAVLDGETVPLVSILEKTRHVAPGDVIEIEFEADGDELVYEVEVLTASGAVRKLRFDARTGRLMKKNGKR